MSAAAIYNLVSASLLVGAVVSLLPIPARRLAGVLAAIVSLFTLAPAVAGFVGPPSATLTQVALLQLCGQKDLIARETIAAALLVILALIFYPLSLGLGPFDPFDIGYRPKLILVAMIPIGIALIVDIQGSFKRTTRCPDCNLFPGSLHRQPLRLRHHVAEQAQPQFPKGRIVHIDA